MAFYLIKQSLTFLQTKSIIPNGYTSWIRLIQSHTSGRFTSNYVEIRITAKIFLEENFELS